MTRINRTEYNGNYTYTIQERFAWIWWVDQTALADDGSPLPCIYAFDTFEEALYHSESDVLITKEIVLALLKK